jgi:hypothetical protein
MLLRNLDRATEPASALGAINENSLITARNTQRTFQPPSNSKMLNQHGVV